MQKVKKAWFRVPVNIRKPIIFLVGWVFIIASLLTGWLPGPGGIPLFIIGITILATEFAWAKRLERYAMMQLKKIMDWYKTHKFVGSLIGIIGIATAITFGLFIYNKVLT